MPSAVFSLLCRPRALGLTTLALLLATSATTAQSTVALIVDNRADEALDGRIEAFQQMLAAELTQSGFTVIDPAMVVESLKSYGDGEIANDLEAEQSGAAIDALLRNNTAAVRFAQNLDATHICHVSLLAFDQRQEQIKAYGLNTIVQIFDLSAAVKVVSGVSGKSLLGDRVTVTHKERVTESVQQSDSGILNRLLMKLSTQLSESMAEQSASKPLVAENAEVGNTTLAIRTELRGITFPVIAPDKSDHYEVGEQSISIVPSGVTVQLNGLTIGSAPGKFSVAPGLHSLTLTRDDLEPWTRMIKVSEDGLELTVSMEINAAAEQRWKDNAQFISALKGGEKLTDAKVEMMRGVAEMFRQSGYKLDIRHEGKGDLDMGEHNIIQQWGAPYKAAGFDFFNMDALDSAGDANTGTTSGNDTASLVEKVQDGVGVCVEMYRRADGSVAVRPFGTAWAYQPNLFATNAHVVEGVREILEDGNEVYVVMNRAAERRYPITAVAQHPAYRKQLHDLEGRPAATVHSDVGLLFTPTTLPKTLSVANEATLRNLKQGDFIAYLGFPMEKLLGGNLNINSPVATFKAGVITSISDPWLGDGGFENNQIIRHDMGSAGGASGSPLFNRQGQVVGLHNAGNYNQLVAAESGEASVQRVSNASMINFGVRADLLRGVPVPQ